MNAPESHDCIDIYKVLRSKHEGIKSETRLLRRNQKYKHLKEKASQTGDTLECVYVTRGQYDFFESFKSTDVE
jgi:uncharacterized protein with GYD domain